MNPKLAQNHYLRVPGFITPQRAEALAQEFYQLEREGRYVKDPQAPNSPAAYNFLPFVRLLVEKVPQVSELCGEPVLPTYVYGRIYKQGEILKRHRDRDACEISYTLNLAQDTEWPIYIQRPSGQEVEMLLQPGDAMMYLGCEADHWREQFTGRNYVQMFIHYVRANGPRAYAVFDREKSPPQTRPAEPVVAVPRSPLPVMPQPAMPLPAGGQKMGRNDPCPCGSGKKYKHCHGKVA